MAILGHSIPRARLFSTAGTNDGFAHVFYNNNYLIEYSIDTYPLIIDSPGFSSVSGTYNYYGSEPESVFVLYTRPSFSIAFTSNTEMLSSDTRLTYIAQELYTVDHNDVLAYRAEPTVENWNRVRDSLETPAIVYSASTSAITSAFTFSILPDQFMKSVGSFTQEVFQDRSQCFISTRLHFEIPSSNSGSTSASTFETRSRLVNEQIVTIPYSSNTEAFSNDITSIITQGSWSGLTVSGLFFTCLQPPSKPVLQFPYPATAITSNLTFTPIFNFSNVEDGDSFVLDVTYDLTDTGFTNTSTYSGVTQYFRDKTESNVEQVVDRTSTFSVGADSTTTMKIRRFSAPMRPNNRFLYRIGNVKSIINLFGIEQKVINYSTHFTGATGTDEVMNVYVDSRSATDPVAPNPARGIQGTGTAPGRLDR